MKGIMIVVVASALFLSTPLTHSAAPDEITYQGRLLQNGSPVTEPTTIAFALYEFQSGGSALWSDSQSVDPDDDGVYTVTLGSQANPIPSGYDALWLQVTVSGTVLSPREQLTSAPYALDVGTLPNLHVSGDVGIGTSSPDAKLEVVGTIHSSSGGFMFPDGSVQTTAGGGGGGSGPIVDEDTTGSGTATASGTTYGSPSDVFDNNINTFWEMSSGGYPRWLSYDFGAGNAKVITKYYFDIRDHGDYTGRMPHTWTLQGSNDGTNWTSLDVRRGQAFQAGRANYALANAAAYRYYRIYVHAGNSSILRMGEMELTEAYVSGGALGD